MSVETQVLALFEEGNPVPDLEGLVVEPIDAAAYLSTLEQRRSEVTRLETKKREGETEMSSRRAWMVAAAAFVAGLSVAVILTSLGGGDASPASGSDTGAIAFAHTVSSSGDSLFAAEGAAVVQGLMCEAAIGSYVGEEDGDGNVLTDQQADALWSGTDPFATASVEQMICDDGSGNFILRVFTEVDPTDPEFSPDTADTSWTITGGQGYEMITGEGEASPGQHRNGIDVRAASGSITNNE